MTTLSKPDARRRVLGRALLTLAALSVPTRGALAAASTSDAPDRHFVYAEDFAGIPTTRTGGIQEAIDSCGCGLAKTTGCTIVLPRGVVTVMETIRIGTRSAADPCSGKDGLVLRGHGSGERNSNGDDLAGTTLLAGTDGMGAVLQLWNVSWSRFESFSIDGDRKASIGIDTTSDLGVNGHGTSQQNVFESIRIDNLKSPSVAVRVAPRPGTPCDCQVAETSFRNITTIGVDTSYLQEGIQTTGMKIEDSVLLCRNVCLDLRGGQTYVYNSYIGTLWDSDPRSPDPVADVKIGAAMGTVLLQGNTHESCSASIIATDPGERYETTTLIGERLQQYRGFSPHCRTEPTPGNPYECDPCYLINHRQNGTFVTIGGFYFAWGRPQDDAHKPRIHFELGQRLAGRWLNVVSHGNSYAASVKWDDIERNTILVDADDRPGANSAFESMNWLTRNVGTGNQHPMVLHNYNAKGDPDIVAWITQGARFRFFKPGGGLEFAGAHAGDLLSVEPATIPTGRTTLSLPNTTGTVVVSGPDAPATAVVGFSKPTGHTTQFCSPYGSACSSTESAVSLAMPALRAKTLRCKSSAAPGVPSSWSISLRVAGTTIGSACSIANLATSCSVDLGAAPPWAEGAEVALRFLATGAPKEPAAAGIVCSLGVGP